MSIAGASPAVRATSIITALENRAQLEDVQKAAGHRDPSTTKLYDRRGYNRERRLLRRTDGSQAHFVCAALEVMLRL